MLSFVDPIAAKLERLESKPSLALESVDFTMRDRDAVRARLGAPLAYSQRVEAMVTGLSIELLLPRVSQGDGYINRFLTIWEPDEQGHARALERLLIELELDPFPLPEDEPVPLHNRLAGLLGGASTAGPRDGGADLPHHRSDEREARLLGLRAHGRGARGARGARRWWRR